MKMLTADWLPHLESAVPSLYINNRIGLRFLVLLVVCRKTFEIDINDLFLMTRDKILKHTSLETLAELNSTEYVANQTDKMMDSMLDNTVKFCIMGAAVWFCGWVQAAGMMTVANREGFDN